MKKSYCLLFYLLSISVSLLAQDITITGKVVGRDKTPLEGVTVSTNGTNVSTTTSAQGLYSIKVGANTTELVFSFVSMEPITEKINARKQIDVTMLPIGSLESEVVVVGYGTQKKANLTGAVDQVTSEALENRSLTNLNAGLQGVLPNLNIRPLDGKPNAAPSFNIRGATSIGQGGNALVLIDGVEGSASLINPNDIATISILKDAASAAIYGARGAFGVVLITTKNPSKGKTSITYTTNVSTKKPTTLPDYENNGLIWAQNFAASTVAWEGTFPQAVNKTLRFSQAYLTELERRSKDPSLPLVDIDPITKEYVYYGSTDWMAELYKKNTSSTEHNLTISGSSEKTSFLITGRYFGQKGLFRYNSDDYRVLNFRMKGSVQVYKWLSVENNADFSNSKYHNPLNVGEGSGIWRNIADEGHPLGVMFNPDGTLTASSAYTVGDFWYGKNGIDTDRSIFRNRTSSTASFFNNKFRIKGDFTFQIRDESEQRKQVPVPYSSTPGVIAYVGTTTNDIREVRSRTQYIATNLYTEYENNFGNHYVKGMVGMNYEESTFKGLTAQRNGLIFENATDINLALGQAISTGGGWEQWAIFGGFGRINYSYKDRYLVEINGRYDGSSKFPSNQRYGFFPSISAGWRVSNEAFWNISPSIISDLKFRGSYGSLGNGNIGSYAFQEQLGISQLGIIINGVRPQFTSRPSVLPDGLTWETSTTTNVGIDLALINNKLRFVADAYVRKTTDMFTVGLTLPAVFGATPPRGNYADLETRGWEMTLSWRDKINVGSKPFNYDIRLTMADNVAKIKKFNNPDKRLSDYYEGQTIGEIWGYTNEGFFTSPEDVTKHAKQTLFLSTSNGATFAGDIKLKDVNGDGVVDPGLSTVANPGDRTVIGNSSPRYLYGINLGADWNNFFFSVFFQGVGKQDWWPSTEAGVFWGQYNRPYGKIPRWHLDNHWTPETPNAYMPRYVSRLANRAGGVLTNAQSGYLQNVAYIRMKNIQLGYTLPKKLSGRIGANDFRVYISCENLWTYSPIYKLTKDIDPENTGPSDQVFTSTNAGDAYNYPLLKGITFGLSVTF